MHLMGKIVPRWRGIQEPKARRGEVDIFPIKDYSL